MTARAEADGPAVDVGIAPAPRRPAPQPRSRGRLLDRVVEVWPTWPVAALAVIAVATWMLASWNEHVRLHRQRCEVRLAREPAAARQDIVPTGTSAGGAVIR